MECRFIGKLDLMKVKSKATLSWQFILINPTMF